MLTMNHVRKIWRGAAVALAVAAPATAQAAGWTPAVEQLGADGGGSTPALAANAAGDLVVAGGDGPLATIRLGGAAFTAPVRVGTGAAQDVHAAINAGGDVAVAWFAGGAVHYAVRPRGGRFGTVHDLPSAGNGIDDVRVGIDDTGEVALAWSGIAHGWPDLHYAVFGPDGATLAAGANDPAKNAGAYFDVAADGDGNVVVAYSETDGTSSTPVAAVRAAGGSTFSVAPLGAGFSGTMPRLDAVLDGAGHAAVAFESSIDDVLEVHAAYAAAGGAFGPELAVSTPGQSSLRPMIGLGARGDVAITWTDPWTMKARVRTGTAGQPFTAPITTFSTGTGRPAVAVAPNGRTVAAWSAPAADGKSVFSAVREPGDAFVEQAPLGPGPSGHALDQPYTPVAIDSQGHAYLAWLNAGRLELTTDDPAGLAVAPPSVVHGDPAPGETGTTGTGRSTSGDGAVPAPRAASPRRCKVPALTGLSYVSAKARLRSAHCAIGKATRPKGRRTTAGLVIGRQSRRAGTLTKAGAKVDVLLRVKKRQKPTHRR